MDVRPYVSFEGRCEEALNFYKGALGAEITSMMRFRDAPDPPPPGMLPPGSEDKVMHASLRIGEREIFATDGCSTGDLGFKGISLTLEVATPDEADSRFAALADGGTVTMPLGPTFFAKRFGMVADRFGVGWMVIAAA
jgi:PhnB protein